MERIQKGLYDSAFEHDACGIGAVISIDGTKSHKVVDDALKIVEKLEHRAGKDAAGETGDGVGILLQISHKFFSRVAKEKGIEIGKEREYAVGMFFFPTQTLARNQAKKLFEVIAKREGLELLFWRTVPVCTEVLGEKAKSCMPYIEQVFIKKPDNCKTDLDFERKLYIARRVFEQSTDNIYIPSLSCRTIVYKGMFLVHQLRKFYCDLQSEDYVSAIALVHSRFSTNTNPSWERAHPNRYILHNGEINTIRGNIDRMLSREETMDSPLLRDDMDKVLPVVDTSGSDSSMLDNTIEFLVMNGMPLPLAMMIVIPEPWRNVKNMSVEKRAFYEYYSTMMATLWVQHLTETVFVRQDIISRRTAILFCPVRSAYSTSTKARSSENPALSRAKCFLLTPSKSESSTMRSSSNTSRAESRTANGWTQTLST